MAVVMLAGLVFAAAGNTGGDPTAVRFASERVVGSRES
jgi:hypothetical protein